MNRRRFLSGLGSLLAAPAIVPVRSLMPLREVSMAGLPIYAGIPMPRLDMITGAIKVEDLAFARLWLDIDKTPVI